MPKIPIAERKEAAVILSRRLTLVAPVLLLLAACSAARGETSAASGCAAPEWDAAGQIEIGLPDSHWPVLTSAAADGEDVVVAGMLYEGAGETLTMVPPYLFIERAAGPVPASMPVPRNGFYPWIALRPDGSHDLVWGEVEGGPDDAVMRRVHSIWYSRWNPATGWAHPVRLATDSRGFYWHGNLGAQVRAGDGAVHVAVTNEDLGNGRISYARLSDRDRPIRSEISLPTPATPWIALEVHGTSILIATVIHSPGISPGGAVVLYGSQDSGQSWSRLPAPAVEAVLNVGSVHLVRTRDARLHLLVGVRDQMSMWPRHFIHLTSDRAEDAWVQQAEFHLPGMAPDVQVEGDACGRLHLFAKNFGKRISLIHTWWNGDRWSQLSDMLPEIEVGSFSVARDPSATLHVVYNEATDGPSVPLGRIKLRIANCCE